MTQVTILRQLTILLRSGKFTGDIDGPPSSIVHIGHSYGIFIPQFILTPKSNTAPLPTGSLLSNSLIATSPSLSDGAILTGLAYYRLPPALLTAFQFRIATLQSPGRWPGRDLQYLTGVDAAANAQVFFHSGSYDEEALWYAESIKQPIAAVELFSVGNEMIFPQMAKNFTGPVMVRSYLTLLSSPLFCFFLANDGCRN